MDRLRKCLTARVDAGVFSQDKADMMEALVKDLEREYRDQMAPELAGQAAAAEAVRIMREAAQRHKRREALQIMAEALVLDNAASHPDGIVAGAMATLTRDIRGKATYSNVESRREVVLGQIYRRFEVGLNAYRPKAAGLTQDTIGIRNLVRELFGEGTNDPVAKAAAQAWRDASDYAAKRYAAAGGDLVEREDWRLPQVHDEARMRKAGFEAWRDAIMPLLDDGTWRRLESVRQELIGQRGEVDKALQDGIKERDRLRASAAGAKGEFDAATRSKATAERRIGQLEKQLGEVERELETQQKRAMEAMLRSRERRMDEVGDALVEGDQDLRAAARRGDRKAERDRTRAAEGDTSIRRLEGRRDDLRRQLDGQRAKVGDAEQALAGKSGQWQAYEEDLRKVEQRIGDLRENRRIIAERIDGEPGEISAAHREDVLRYIFDQITSPVPKNLLPGTMSVSRHNARRFFVFKDAESWLRYQDQFGAGRQVYDVMVGHMEAMARDIALTEVLGPKHGTTMRRLQEAAHEGAAAGAKTMGALESPAAIARTYDVVSGRLGTVQNEFVGALFGGLRNWMTATKLGGALISAVPSDTVMATWAAKANGIPAVKLLGQVVKQLNPASDADRAFALRLGIVSSAVQDAALGSKRFADEIVGEGITARLASFIVRAQGLSAWTNGMKNAFMLEFMGYIADSADKPLAEVSKPLRRMLRRYGFSAADWDAIRAAPMIEHVGARFFDPGAVADRRLGERLMEAIIEERAFAVLEPDARVRQITTAGLQRGTVMGEVARSGMLFKSFALTMITTHMLRAAQQETALGKLAHFGAFTGLLTVAGAAAMQAKALVAGKDPRRMDDPAFWGAAMLQGGALGIFGDFLSTGYTRGDRGFVATAAGPVLGGLTEDVARVTLPNVRQLYEGEPTRMGAELARLVRQNLPGTNLWYARLVMDRTLMDGIQSLADPEYRQSFARMERKARQDFGQRFWWRPGQTAPERAPDLGAMLPQ